MSGQGLTVKNRPRPKHPHTLPNNLNDKMLRGRFTIESDENPYPPDTLLLTVGEICVKQGLFTQKVGNLPEICAEQGCFAQLL